MFDSAQGASPLTAAADEPSAAASTFPLPRPVRGWWHRKTIEGGRGLDFTDDTVRPNAWVPIALIALLVTAFLFRFSAAQHLSSHVDEAASVMAAKMVAEKGVPLYPSGTLYLQGATISYILAPLIALGYGGIDNLLPLRVFSVLISTLAVYFAYRLGRTVTGSAAAGFIAALLLAADPASVRWGAMVRMYAPLQCISLVVIWLFLRALLRRPVRRELILVSALFWLGVFTHIAICLLFPALAIGAVLVYGRTLLDQRRDLTATLVAMATAPVVMLGLNTLVAPPNKAVSSSLPGISFVGDFLFSSNQLLHPSLKSWTLLFGYSRFGVVLPMVILASSCVLAGRYFLGTPVRTRFTVQRSRVLATLFLLYWLPIIAVAGIATEQNERYLIHIQPIGLILLVLLVYDLFAFPLPADHAAMARVSLDPAAIAEPRFPRRITPRASGALPVAGRIANAVPIERIVPSWLSARVLGLLSFAAVILVGAAVRLSHLNHLSLWLDEGFTVLYSQQAWGSVAGLHGFYSPHPPLYFTLVKVSDLFVSSQIAGRAISVIAGIATIPVFYLLMAKVLDRRAAFAGSLVLALSPIQLYYSQEARMYALVVFLVTVSYYALVSFHWDPRWRWAVLYGLSAGLLLWLDYSATYALAPQAALILVQLVRHRRGAVPLFVAGVVAMLAYVPWIPQVLSSIDAANQVERRESYLGVSWSRIGTTLLAMMGYAGDGSYFQTLRPTAWNRYPDSRAVFLLAALPVVALGLRGLWRRWGALAVVVGLLSTMLVGIWVSLISPGFAERTVLATSVGWAALLGAAFSAKCSRLLKAIATFSLIAVLLIQSSTIDVLYNGAIKQQWRTVSADVALVSPLHYPIITYSYGAVADTLVDVYQPHLLEHARVITIRDGGLENVLSNGVIPEVGLTRTNDLPAGKLNEALPNTPENDFVWYLYYTREGELDVRAAIKRAGYSLLLHNEYRAPRYQVYLDLFARPSANLGAAVPLDATFASDGENGWVMPASGASVTPAAGGAELLIANQTFEQHGVSTLVDTHGMPAIATFSVQVKSAIAADATVVMVSCVSTAGAILATQTAEVPPVAGNADAWRTARVAALCPADTTSLLLSLQNLGQGEMTFRQPTLDLIAIPPMPPTS